jgi:hypothetical protein
MISNLPIYNQGTTQLITTTLKDETGALIPTAGLTALTATLTVRTTGAVINSRSVQDIKNANGGTYVDGVLTLTLSPADSPHAGQSPIEDHVLLLRWTYNSGASAGVQEILLRVRDVGRV